MTVYMSPMRLRVCQHIGCAKQATQSVWNDDELIGVYCRAHGEAKLKELSCTS